MIVTAWTNGQQYSSGAGYGLKIDATDRDRYFQRDWKTITLVLEGQSAPVSINIAKPSFWGKTCRELISAEIGRWMLQNKLAPWPQGHPPKLKLDLQDGNHFRLKQITE